MLFFLSLILCHIFRFMLNANMHSTIFPENLSIFIFMRPLPLYIFLTLTLFSAQIAQESVVTAEVSSELHIFKVTTT